MRFRISVAIDRIRWFFQRGFRGFDDRAIWNIDVYLRDQLLKILPIYKENTVALWNNPETHEPMTEEEMNAVLDTLIFHLRMMDEDYVEKELFGSNVEDDDYVVGSRTIEEYQRISEVQNQNKDLALDLLKTFWWQLWD